MASTLKINTLTGVSTAGSIAVTAEGNSTTTNLQQGLAKHWVNYDAVSQVTHGSFNQSTLTDNDTGDFTTHYTNNLSGAEDKCIVFGAWNTNDNGSNIGAGNERGSTSCNQYGPEVSATSKVRYTCHYGSTGSSNGGLYDYEGNYCATLGDLA